MNSTDQLEVTFATLRRSCVTVHWEVDGCSCHYDKLQGQSEGDLTPVPHHFAGSLDVGRVEDGSDQRSCEEVTAASAATVRVVQEIWVANEEIPGDANHMIEVQGSEAETQPG